MFHRKLQFIFEMTFDVKDVRISRLVMDTTQSSCYIAIAPEIDWFL